MDILGKSYVMKFALQEILTSAVATYVNGGEEDELEVIAEGLYISGRLKLHTPTPIQISVIYVSLNCG